MKINVLSHYDLDGVVSVILLRKILGSKIDKISLTGYGKLNDKLSTLLACSESLIITDLSIDEKRFKMLSEATIPILFIDHHETSLDTLKDKSLPENVKNLISTKFCGAGLVMQYFNKKYKFSDNLKLLAKYANDYDLWIHKYEESKVLNNCFWEYGANVFQHRFKDGFNYEHYKRFLPIYKQNQEFIKQDLDEATKIEINDKYKALIITISKHIGEVTEHFKSFDVYFIIMSDKKLAVRLKIDLGLNDIFNKVRDNFDIESIGCHKLAGGINLKKSSEDVIMNIIEFIYEQLLEGDIK